MSNEAAPKTSLPSWLECQGMISNRDYLVKCGAIKNGVLVDDFYADSNSLNITPLHEFIYEYDDADHLKSGWFRHRLEMALDYKERTAKPKIKLTKALPTKPGYYYWSLGAGDAFEPEIVETEHFGGLLIVDRCDGYFTTSELGGYWAKVDPSIFEIEEEEENRRGLDELTQLSQDLGMYNV